MANALYFGDNLEVLRESIKDESVDLIYLDPPFNSNAMYNVLFKTPKGHSSDAQIEAFDDTWHWGEQAEAAFAELMQQSNTDVAEVTRALRSVLGDNDMMAYATMMAIRLLELHRVLKPTGSLYLHCDPTASHYLKIVLDQVFDVENFRNEVIWLRTTPKGHAFTRFPSNHDTILFYAKGASPVWHQPYTARKEGYIDSHYGQVDEQTGRHYQLTSLLNPNHDRPNLTYEFPPGSGVVRVWRWTQDRMMKAWNEGLIVIPKGSGVARFKRFLDEQAGTPVTSVWTDVPPINSQAAERLGYPRRSHSPSSNALSRRPPTRATSCLIHSAAAVLPSMPPRS